jgi:hypothetical protein
METVQEWIDNPHGGVVWFHGMDFLQYVMKNEPRQSAFQNSSLGHYRTNYDNFVSKVKEYRFDRERLSITMEQVLSRPRKRNKYRTSVDGDDLDVDSYIETFGETSPKIWDEPYKIVCERRQAVNVYFECSVPWVSRKQTYIANRQHLAYNIALNCEQDGVPCRIVTCYGVRVSEVKQAIVFHIVIKDFDEPIYPPLWGVFLNNETTNTAVNLLSEMVIGTGQDGNGLVVPFVIQPTENEEFQVLDLKSCEYMQIKKKGMD